MAEITQVVAALVIKDGRFMICRRPPHKARGLLWEFVGGKVEPGESGEEALVRECREELGVEISVGDVFMRVLHEYPDITICLTVYYAEIAKGEPQMLEHVGIEWITPEQISGFEFCPADEEILKKIKDAKKMNEVYEFLKKCGTYYLATNENGQPRVRPFGTIDIYNGRLYFQTGKRKEVSKQLHADPRFEICAFDGGKWLRISGKATEDPDIEAQRHMLAGYPELANMYQPGDGNNEVFYITDATAVFSSFTEPPKTVTF